MAAFAERLPVCLVPEQCGITLVRNDMINNRGGDKTPLLEALDTERIVRQESF
jgi:hypothetical protein